ITYFIDPANPQFVSFEGTDFNSTFSNVGHMQFGVDTPGALLGQDVTVTFDIDNVRLVPGPAAATTLLLGGLVGLRRRR
ncbi:MAG: hypothetical protein AAFX05_14570, partial [Planctomycetota bacterium]